MKLTARESETLNLQCGELMLLAYAHRQRAAQLRHLARNADQQARQCETIRRSLRKLRPTP